MKIYTMNGVGMVHIAEFASALNRSIQSTRRLIENGNTIRKLKFYRDRSRLMIPVAEIYGYPFVNAGHSKNEREVFHFRKIEDGTFERYFCQECTFGEGCAVRKQADELVVPEGDK